MSKGSKERTLRIGTVAIGLTVAACLIALVVTAPLARAEADQPSAFIESYTITPQVLAPGDHGTISAVIKSTATTATLQESSGSTSSGSFETVRSIDIPIQIDSISIEGNGITVLSGTYLRFGSLGPGQSATVTFAIQAPGREGIYFPEILVDINGGKNVRYPIPVNVNAKNNVLRAPALVVTKSVPASVNPGDSFQVGLNLMNAGVLRAGQVILSLNTSSTSIGVTGSNTLVLNDLEGGATKDITIDFITDKKAPIGLQKITLLFTYQLPDGTATSQTEVIEVPVKGRAELGLVTVDTNPSRVTEKAPFDLTIRIENTGTGDAEKVSARIDLPVEGKKETFIGKIKPGNDAPAVFLLEGAPAGNLRYTLNITYTDDMGTHTVMRDMNLRVSPADMSGTIITLLIVIVIVAAAGYRFWYLPRINGDGKFPWEKRS